VVLIKPGLEADFSLKSPDRWHLEVLTSDRWHLEVLTSDRWHLEGSPDILTKSVFPGYKLRFLKGKKKCHWIEGYGSTNFYHALFFSYTMSSLTIFFKGFWEASYKRPHVVGCHLYERSRNRHTRRDASRLVAVRGWEEGYRE